MEKWKTHLFSFLTLSVFLLLALASELDTSIDYGCADKSLQDSEPLTGGVLSATSFQILLLDKETNLPIPSVYLDLFWKGYYCVPLVECPEYCNMTIGSSVAQEGVTNSSGKYNNTTPEWKAVDKKDRMTANITIVDPSGQYATKYPTVRVIAGQSSASFTFYLLKNSSL